MGYCSVPRAFGFGTWFNKRFNGLCKQHDEYYSVGIMSRYKADCLLMAGIALKGYPTLAYLAFLAVRIFGARHYNRKK